MNEKQYAAMLKFCCKTKFRKETLLRFCKRTPWLLMGIYVCFIAFLAFIRDTKIVLFVAVPVICLLYTSRCV